jgi:hypothetical protein
MHRPVAARDPAEIARAIAGAQAQDTFAGPLQFRSRSRRLLAADIDRARTEERSLLRTWVMRRTIHLIPTDDAGWMLPLFEPTQEKWSRARLAALGMPPRRQEKALKLTARQLEADGPLTRPELGERLAAKGVELNAQTRTHMFMLATTSGLACLGPDRKGGSCLVLRGDWLGAPPRFEREAALAELARRYLRAFGPASDRDMQRWSGLGLREVRTGLEAIAPELAEETVGGVTLLSLKASRPRLPAPGQVRLLGAFDTYVLGYASRDFAVAPDHGRGINTRGGGMIEPVIARDGELLGTWRLARGKKRAEVALQPFAGLELSVREAVDAEVEDLGRFEGREVVLIQPG